VYSLDSAAFRLLYQRNPNMIQKVKSVPLDHIFLSAMELIRPFSLISYTKEDEGAFRQLPAKVKRVGAQDCRIGVQAQRRGLIVVTQNIADFAAAGFACEDWSLESPS
jgi:hypothetical protein